MNLNLKGKVIFFATGNIHKFNEARAVLSAYSLASGMLHIKGAEIQSDSLKEIATASAANAYNLSHLPLIVEDAGLFVDALNGFPGPYAAYVYKTVENAGLLKLMNGIKNRRAIFRSSIAYCDSETGTIMCFEGETAGEITTQKQTLTFESAFGFDPIFQPHGCKKTFAEMTLQEKNGVSHRAQAVRKFAEWYIKQ